MMNEGIKVQPTGLILDDFPLQFTPKQTTCDPAQLNGRALRLSNQHAVKTEHGRKAENATKFIHSNR